MCSLTVDAKIYIILFETGEALLLRKSPLDEEIKDRVSSCQTLRDYYTTLLSLQADVHTKNSSMSINHSDDAAEQTVAKY